MLYGPPGAGKTSLAAQAPKPVFFDFERSTDVLRHTPGKENTAVIIPQSMEQVLKGIQELPRSEYETVVIDTISSGQDFQLAEHMIAVEKRDKNRSRHLPLFQDFRISTQIWKEIFATLQEMPINVVLIAHDKELTRKRDDGTDQLIGIRPELTPRLNESVIRLINIAAYLTTEPSLKGDPKRKLYVNSSGHIQAKNRLGLTQPFIEDPTWQLLTKGVK